MSGVFILVYSNPLILKLWTPRVKSARIIWEKVEAATRVWADFHFDGETVIYFPLEVLPTVAELAGAIRRSRLSEDHKAKLVDVARPTDSNLKSVGLMGRKTGEILMFPPNPDKPPPT